MAHLYHTLYWELVTPGRYSSGTSVPYFILGVCYSRDLCLELVTPGFEGSYFINE